jgi:hypothetical protein
MNRIIDNAIALRILYLLQQPFEDTDAFKLGIIDKNGKLIKPVEAGDKEAEDAYNMLVRIVFNIKRLIGVIPGGKSRLATLTAGFILVKECYEREYTFPVSMKRYEEVAVRVRPSDERMVKLMLEEVAATNVTNVAPHPTEEIPARKNRKPAMVRRNIKRTLANGGFISFKEHKDLSCHYQH